MRPARTCGWPDTWRRLGATAAFSHTRQAFGLLLSRRVDVDAPYVAKMLTPRLAELFQRMQHGDQVHSIAVAQRLEAGGVTDRELLQAALLHDVGKSLARVRLWHRMAHVLLRAFLPRRRIGRRAAAASSWLHPLWILEHHPRLGADLAASAGASRRVVSLVRRHQSDEGAPAERRDDLRRLREADDGR
ncbi:MAG: HD domain-containing protein [Chloroflexi bacterium]|nr:HD domain-containing protein [Chloroflexota bacterium]